jgi:protoporphyrinogen/coproporphyrinogen III oxidase
MTACTFASNKWPHWARPGTSLVRVSAGRATDTSALDLDDAALTDRLLDELGQALGRSASPSAVRVSRWPDSFPQFEVGHLERIAEAQAEIERRMPTAVLAGASCGGSGIPACIASGREAARRVVRQATGPTTPVSKPPAS